MSAKRILIVDTVATKAYDGTSLQGSGLGGTEATVIKVAESLTKYYKVFVAQSARNQITLHKGVVYMDFDHKHVPNHLLVDVVINVRAHKILPRIRRAFPKSQMYLWMHCNPGKRLKNLGQTCIETNTTLVGVSQYHANILHKYCLRYSGGQRLPRITYHYNPVSAYRQTVIRKNPYKLINMSSPHKGLAEVIKHFKYCRQHIPELELYIANPGYLNWQVGQDGEGIVSLGSLPQRDLHHHLQESLCLFYPQTSFAETFGLVYAEAQALSTPVLCSDIGSASEIVAESGGYVLRDTSSEKVLETLKSWLANGAPKPKAQRQFHISQVTLAWRKDIERKHEVFDKASNA